MRDMLTVLIFVAAVMGAAVGVYAAVTVISVLRKRLESGRLPQESTREELDTIQSRLSAAESLESRVSELEERLDFAERLLAQQHDSKRLPQGPLLDQPH